MIIRALLGVALLCIYFSSTHASVGGYICPASRKKLLIVLAKTLGNAFEDISTPYFGAKGFNLMDHNIPTIFKKENCAHLKASYKNTESIEEIFYALAASPLLECTEKLYTDETIKIVQAVLINEKSTISEIRYAAEILKLIKVAIPNGQKIAKLIQAKLKADDSLQNLGHALHAAALLGSAGNFISDRIEEVVVQADEVDGKLLQWEGGLTTTSLLITGLLGIPGTKPFTPAQAEKLANYLLTRTTVQTPKGALALLEAAIALAASDVSPVTITIDGPSQVTIDKPELKIHISDLVGAPLKSPPTPIVAQSATRITDDVVVLSKQPLSPGTSPVEFILPLRLDSGQYKIALTAGSHSTTLISRVLGPVTVEWAQVGLNDADGSSTPKLTKLQYPAKLSTNLLADSSHHLSVKLALSRVINQVFLRLYTGNTEIIFVAEQDSSKLYKIDVKLASELAQSGTFDMELILGDSVMSNPLRWSLGTIELKLNVAASPKKSPHVPKPEIEHLFRPAEKRPPETVSLLFTGITLAPLGLVLILWLKIGINFGNFTPLAIPFHLGFGGILSLFFLFWVQLDMFTTCAWLIPVGGFTFLAGQKLLSHTARQKKA